MGTSGSLAFALEQKQLPVKAQLALIMIADKCSDHFTIEDAINCITSYTRIDADAATRIVQWLITKSLVPPSPWGNGQFYVPELFMPSFPATRVNTPVRVVDNSGYVYLIQSTTGTYKIGRTVNPQSRFQTFKLALPFEVEYVCIIQASDMYTLESELHARYADKRVNGEWFTLTPEDVEYIKSLAVQS